MITEDYVSFETAKLLKEKGFDEHCFCINYPLPEGGHHNIILPNLLNNSMIPFIDEYKFCRYKEDFITIPTHQMAIKWLREVHNIFIDICTLNPSAYTYRVCLISDTTGCFYEDYACEEGERFMSYEEAVEFALDYCLNNIL